jgi:hypothetical protein
MKKELADNFNKEVERYRQTLLKLARSCDWDTFKMKAGNLFDYVEWIEIAEIENRFFRIFKSVLVVLVAVVVAIVNMDVAIHPDLARVRYSIILLAIAGSCFELYFFLDFRMYMEVKSLCYQKRRDKFIRNIEKDFREIILPQCGSA